MLALLQNVEKEKNNSVSCKHHSKHFYSRLLDVGGLAAKDVIVHFYLVSFDIIFNFEVKDAGNGQHLFRKL